MRIMPPDVNMMHTWFWFSGLVVRDSVFGSRFSIFGLRVEVLGFGRSGLGGRVVQSGRIGFPSSGFWLRIPGFGVFEVGV